MVISDQANSLSRRCWDSLAQALCAAVKREARPAAPVFQEATSPAAQKNAAGQRSLVPVLTLEKDWTAEAIPSLWPQHLRRIF